MMKEERCIGDIAAEIIGISRCISMIELLVKPIDTTGNPQGVPSQDTVDGAFFAVTQQLDRIADDLNDLECVMLNAKKAATPTDESKDCR